MVNLRLMRIGRGLVLLGVLALAGCARAAPKSAEQDAHANAVEQAQRTYHLIAGPNDIGRYAQTAEQLGRRTVESFSPALLAVNGTQRDEGDGVRLTIQVHAVGTSVRSIGLWSTETEHAEVTVCFDLVVASEGKPQGMAEVTCPTAEPIAYPPLPTFPPNLAATLKDRLGALSSPDAASVNDVLDGLRLDPSIRRDVSADGSKIGVALQTVEFACVLARIQIAAPVEVWSLAQVYLRPGEVACDSASAVAGWGQRPPH